METDQNLGQNRLMLFPACETAPPQLQIPGYAPAKDLQIKPQNERECDIPINTWEFCVIYQSILFLRENFSFHALVDTKTQTTQPSNTRCFLYKLSAKYLLCWSSGNALVSGAGGLRFKSRASQIRHSIANGSPPLQYFFKWSCVAWAQ